MYLGDYLSTAEYWKDSLSKPGINISAYYLLVAAIFQMHERSLWISSCGAFFFFFFKI